MTHESRSSDLVVSAVVVAFGSTPRLPECIDRILASVKVDVEVIVIDNGSTDGTLDLVGTRAGVRVIAAGANLGFGGGCNRGVAASERPLVAFVNPDVLVEADALYLLAEAASQPHIGIASAAVRLLDEPDLVNSAGGAMHFLGLGWAEGYRQKVTTPLASTDRDVIAASGAAMVMRRDVFVELGGFTEELFLYHEDADLSLRCWQRGWVVRYIADAVVHHDYEFGRNPRKLQLLERNRLIVVFTCYSPRLLAVVAPALVLYEAGVFALSIAQGWAREKVDGWWWLVRHVRWLRARRRSVQSDRRRSDQDLVPLFAPRFTGAQVAMPKAIEPGDRLLGTYWRVASRWV